LADEQGKFGSATRQVVNDPLSPKLGIFKAPEAIRGGGAGGVAGYDTSHIGDGQRAIANLLGTASTIYGKYLEDKKDQWELDGKLAYAQGKTEDEIRATGNKYTLGGFMTMNVRTASNQFAADMREQIATTDKMKSPDEFRTSLSKAYEDLSNKVGNSNDPFVKQLLSASAEDTMPKLVAEQTLAHNAWKENETFNSYQAMGISESEKPGVSPDHIRELLNPEMSGLSPERHREAVINMLNYANKNKNFVLRDAISGKDVQQALITSKDLPPADQVKAQAMSFVAQVEGGFVSNDGGKGPTLYGINSEANPEEYKLMKAAYDAGDTAGAKAIAKDTYSKKYWDEIGAGSLPADMAIIAFDGAVNQGAPWMKKTLAEIAKTGGGAKELLAARREHYIEIAQNDPTKAKYLDGWLQRLNKLDTDSNSATTLTQTVQGMVSESAMAKNLIANGYSLAQVESAIASSRAGEQAKSLEFDKTRILTEESIENQAKMEGNLPARLDDIARVAAQNGYSDEWKKSMASRVTSGVESQQKERDAKLLRSNAMNSSSLYQTLPADQQNKTIEEHRAQTIAAVAAEPGLTTEQQNDKVREAHGKFLIERNAVDSVWSGQMQSGLAGKLTDGKGVLKPEALNAYKDYLWLAKNSNHGYANKYVGDANTQALLTMAESYDASNLNPEQALLTALEILENERINGKGSLPGIKPDVLSAAMQKYVDKISPTVLATFGTSNAQNYSDMPDWQINRLKTDPNFTGMLQTESVRVIMRTPSLANHPDIAVAQAMKNLAPNLELVQGNVLKGGSAQTIREAMGLNSNQNNIVGAAVDEWMRTKGKERFGPRWDDTQVLARNPDGSYRGYHIPGFEGNIPQPSLEAMGNTLRNAYKGLPPYYARYDADTNEVVIELYQDYNKILTDNNPQRIPASEIGAVYKINKSKDYDENGINLQPLLLGRGKQGD